MIKIHVLNKLIVLHKNNYIQIIEVIIYYLIFIGIYDIIINKLSIYPEPTNLYQYKLGIV